MALKSFRDRNPVVVGVVSLTVLSVAVTTAFLTGTLGLLADRYTMTGVFADTGGLRSGNDVEVAGVLVGKVSEVEPDFTGGRVVITWKVDRDVDLGPRTRAEIRTNNVLGGRYLRLSGPVAEPHMADVPEERRRVPRERTSTPTTVNDVLDSSTEALSGLDTETISKVLAQVEGISEQGRGRLGGALRNLSLLAETVNDSDPQIRRLLSDGNRLVEVVNSKDRELSRLASNASVLLNQLRDRQAELSVLLGSGSRTVQSLTRLISTEQDELISIVDDLGTTMQTLEPQIADLNETLSRAGPTLTGFGAFHSGPFADVVFSQIGPLTAGDLQKLAASMRNGGTAP
ncbi:MlaD family protein [Actinomadura sp. 7K507]|uniref:MCE family protein n=1 Tax=Actinomadura sp. 7K507 TaxID=2530365 RepID=UPI0010539453|nr:MlaD family protein [Actinomadura sp. 7K507]TDC97932.1 MCE family protein [Actinomadura sp. 7K507]